MRGGHTPPLILIMGGKMNRVLKVSNYLDFLTFIKASTSLVSDSGGCEFKYENGELGVAIINDSQTYRAFFTTVSVSSDDDTSFSFCIQELSKLYKALNIIRDIQKDKDSNLNQIKLDLKVTDSFISYSGDLSFKIRLVKRDVVEKNITNPIKAQLVDQFSFVTNDQLLKRMLQCSAIASESAKIYFTLSSNGSVIAEIDDKSMAFTTSVGVQINESLVIGSFKPFILQLDLLKLINNFNLQGHYRLSYTDKDLVLLVNDNGNIKMKVVACVLKN